MGELPKTTYSTYVHQDPIEIKPQQTEVENMSTIVAAATVADTYGDSLTHIEPHATPNNVFPLPLRPDSEQRSQEIS